MNISSYDVIAFLLFFCRLCLLSKLKFEQLTCMTQLKCLVGIIQNNSKVTCSKGLFSRASAQCAGYEGKQLSAQGHLLGTLR